MVFDGIAGVMVSVFASSGVDLRFRDPVGSNHRQ